MRRIPIAAALALLAGCSQSPQPATPAAAAPASPPKPWEPIPFDEKSPRANDVGQFFAAFDEAISKVKKGEFETTKEHEARLADLDRAIPPFSTKAVYAFVPDDRLTKYNADLQAYEPAYPVWCQRNYPIEGGNSCQVGQKVESTDEYVGQNSFGAHANVTRQTGKHFYILFDPSEMKGKQHRDSNGDPVFKMSCPVPLEKAKTLSSNTVAAVMLVRLEEAKLLSGTTYYVEPTVDAPSAQSFDTVGIRAKYEGTVCYVLQTGEVLYRGK